MSNSSRPMGTLEWPLLVTFLIPVSAILPGIFFLDEALSIGQIAGMTLIGPGLLAIDGRLVLTYRLKIVQVKTIRRVKPSMAEQYRIREVSRDSNRRFHI